MKKFPECMLWGGASADFQYEGGFNEGGRGLLTCDFVTDGSRDKPRMLTYIMPDGTTGAVPHRESLPKGAKGYILDNQYYPSHQAVDFYHHYKEDIELYAKMGMTTMRFSICWTRIFPNGDEATPNKEGLDFYESVVDECLKYGIEPLITICHDEIPAYLADKYEGWTNRILIDCYLNLCKALFERLKGKVKYWLTFNEINILVGYSSIGSTKADRQTTLQAIHHMFVASAKAVKMAHEMMPGCMVGAMYASSPCYPATCKPEDVFAWMSARRRLFYYSDVMMRGYYPSFAHQQWAADNVNLVFEEDDERILREGTLDFYSFSHYRSSIVASDTVLGDNGMSMQQNPYLEATPWGWCIDPLSIRYLLNEIYDRYQKPVFIVENGLGDIDEIDENNFVDDQKRISYLKRHFREIRNAVEIDKVPVLGYTMWGAIDLVSLSTGEMAKRYGFIYVDMDDKGNGTKNRYPKASYYWMKEFLETKGANLDD